MLVDNNLFQIWYLKQVTKYFLQLSCKWLKKSANLDFRQFQCDLDNGKLSRKENFFRWDTLHNCFFYTRVDLMYIDLQLLMSTLIMFEINGLQAKCVLHQVIELQSFICNILFSLSGKTLNMEWKIGYLLYMYIKSRYIVCNYFLTS